MSKKMRSLGVASKVKDLGVREELWQDGKVHLVHAYQGVDRKVWIRFSPKFAIGIGSKIIRLRRDK